MTFLLTVGERHEAVMFEPLMEQALSDAKGLDDCACDRVASVGIRVTAAASQVQNSPKT